MASSSSSSSSSVPQLKYEVFLGFRGEDTRKTFNSHLYKALCDKKIKTFLDDQELEVGNDISPSLLNAIEESFISIIVFSEGFPSSRWCLQELVKSLECMKKYERDIIPVFYHVDPSDVRHQKGKFGEAFEEVEKRFKDSPVLLQEWRTALTEAANHSGTSSEKFETEALLVEEIVKVVLKKLDNMYIPSPRGDLVGVEKKVESLMAIGSNGVSVVGLWGMGGIGKTTIARAVFDKSHRDFDSSYFAENVREKFERKKSDDLKEKLFSEILDGYPGSRNQLEWLRRRTILIVFDDISSYEQIEDLIGDLKSLHSGSKIIITTREKRALETCEVEIEKHEIKELSHNDSLQLFSEKAFKQKHPLKGYEELSERIIKYTKGVPLALKVLGSFLYNRGKEDWKSAIDNLKKCPHEDIQKVLKISYDRLNDVQQKVFLDVACFYKGWKRNIVEDFLDAASFYKGWKRNIVEDIVDARGSSSCIVISTLIDKSLIVESDDKSYITMHDLIQEMGKEIIRQESDDPRKRTRLWHHEDIYKVLSRTNTGTELPIQVVSLAPRIIPHNGRLSSHAFAKMNQLRILRVTEYDNWRGADWKNFLLEKQKIDYFKDFKDLESFSTELRYFSWEGYPSESLPLKFRVENLVRLELRTSRIKKLIWNDFQDLSKLKHIDLSGSLRLTEIPNLSSAVNLQELILSDCVSLRSLPGVIHSKSLALRGCVNLKVAPKISCKVQELDLHGTAIIESPVIEQPSKLVKLDLSDCSRLRSLSRSISECNLLEYFSLSDRSKPGGLGINEVTRGTCEKFMNWLLNFLSSLTCLKHLGLANRGITKLPDDLGQLALLKELDLRGNDFDSIPASIKALSNLRFLNVSYCKSLSSLPELPNGISLSANCCLSLESVSDLSFLFSSMLTPQTVTFANCLKLNLAEVLHKERRRRFCETLYPGNEVPEWFSHRATGSFVTLKQQPDWRNLEGFIMCVVVACHEETFGGYFDDVMCKWHMASEDGVLMTHCKWFINDRFEDKEARWTCYNIGLDHVLLGFHNVFCKLSDVPSYLYFDVDERDTLKKMIEKDSEVVVDFDFSFHTSRIEVKACGVHFLYAEEESEETLSLRRDRTHTHIMEKLKSTLKQLEQEPMEDSDEVLTLMRRRKRKRELDSRLKIFNRK